MAVKVFLLKRGFIVHFEGMIFFMRINILIIVLVGFLLNSTDTFADNNSDNMAQVPTKMSYLQIEEEDWKSKKEIKRTKSGVIEQIIDQQTILLKDKTVVRLASIDTPNKASAFDALKELLPPQTNIILYQTRSEKLGRTNRMGHDLAHIVIKEDTTWVQGTLLQNGIVRICTAPKQDSLLPEMIAAENSAIKKNKNLWAVDSAFNILSNDIDILKNHIGDFIVVEATVQKVATINNNVYLNFGNNWKTDFTVMLTSNLRKDLSKKGIDALSLANKNVRVRGWLREYNGPLIELEDIAHLQILEPTMGSE